MKENIIWLNDNTKHFVNRINWLYFESFCVKMIKKINILFKRLGQADLNFPWKMKYQIILITTDACFGAESTFSFKLYETTPGLLGYICTVSCFLCCIFYLVACLLVVLFSCHFVLHIFTWIFFLYLLIFFFFSIIY